VPVVARTPLERQLQDEIICMCGTCGRQLLNACQCPQAVQMRAELSGLVKSGMTHDQVIQYYIDKYGSQEPLAAPIDKGFNRLAWFIPYLVGVSGAAAIGFVALRWSRRQPAVPAEAQPAADPDFEERLDDELRNLD
jgi:cytochrome c-type biogenesis protein CcmH/NrfF